MVLNTLQYLSRKPQNIIDNMHYYHSFDEISFEQRVKVAFQPLEKKRIKNRAEEFSYQQQYLASTPEVERAKLGSRLGEFCANVPPIRIYTVHIVYAPSEKTKRSVHC